MLISPWKWSPAPPYPNLPTANRRHRARSFIKTITWWWAPWWCYDRGRNAAEMAIVGAIVGRVFAYDYIGPTVEEGPSRPHITCKVAGCILWHVGDQVVYKLSQLSRSSYWDNLFLLRRWCFCSGGFQLCVVFGSKINGDVIKTT